MLLASFSQASLNAFRYLAVVLVGNKHSHGMSNQVYYETSKWFLVKEAAGYQTATSGVAQLLFHRQVASDLQQCVVLQVSFSIGDQNQDDGK